MVTKSQLLLLRLPHSECRLRKIVSRSAPTSGLRAGLKRSQPPCDEIYLAGNNNENRNQRHSTGSQFQKSPANMLALIESLRNVEYVHRRTALGSESQPQRPKLTGST